MPHQTEFAGTQRDLPPSLQAALSEIAQRAQGPFGITLQAAIADHLSTFNDAISDGATHRAIAAWLSTAGISSRGGRGPSIGAVSKAIHRANVKAPPASTGGPSSPATTTAPAIQPGSPQLPIPPPQGFPSSFFRAQRAGRLLNELRLQRLSND